VAQRDLALLELLAFDPRLSPRVGLPVGAARRAARRLPAQLLPEARGEGTRLVLFVRHR
jgi:hypothetical protein